MSLVTNAANLSQTVAARIRVFRKRQNLTLNQLADTCAGLGAPQLSFSALANIERGATAESKRKPRDVSLEELLIIARALGIAPALLMFPVGEQDEIQVLPGVAASPWDALQWFAGYNVASGQPEFAETWRVPLFLYRKHELLRDERILAITSFDGLEDIPEDVIQHGKAEADRLWSEIKDVRADMRRHGLTPPAAEGDIEGIDDNPRVYLTGREVESRLAAGQAVRLVDRSQPGALGKVMKPGDGTKLEAAVEQGLAVRRRLRSQGR